MAQITKYNPLHLPFNPLIAQHHRKATSSGRPIDSENRCPCCLIQIQQQPMRINFGMDQINHLGKQYKLFYTFIKIIGLALIIILFDSGLSQFQDVINHQFPSTTSFGVSWSSLSPLYPVDKFWLYSSLSFVTLLTLLFLIRVFYTFKIQSQIDNNVGQEQWSILLKNIPKSIDIQQKLKDLFKRNFDNIKIKEIILIENMQKYNEAQSEIKKQVDAWKKLLSDEQKNKEQITASMEKIHLSKQKLKLLRQQIIKDKNLHFSGNAIIVFDSIQGQQQILKAWKSKFFTKSKQQSSIGEINLNDRQLILAQQAPSASEINWSNISLLNSLHAANQRLNLILLFLVHAGVYLLYFLSQLCLGRKFGQDFSQNISTIVTLIFLSILSYSLMPWAVRIIQNRQKQESQTKLYLGLINKLSYSMLIMKSLVIFAVQNTFMQGPLVVNCSINKIVILLFVDFFISWLFWLVNPHDIRKRIRKFLASRNTKITQQQAQQIYERPSHNIPYKYGFLICSFWIATMFANLAPVGLVITIVSLLVFYWCDKLNLAKRSSVSSKKISQKFTYQFIFLVEKSLILKPFINLLFWSIANQKVAIPEIVMFVLGVIYNITPKDRIVNKVLQILKFHPKIAQHVYDQKLMPTLYRLQNPITGGTKLKLSFLQASKKNKILAKIPIGNFAQSITMSQVIQPPKTNFYEKVQKLGQQPQPQETDRGMVNQ